MILKELEEKSHAFDKHLPQYGIKAHLYVCINKFDLISFIYYII